MDRRRELAIVEGRREVLSVREAALRQQLSTIDERASVVHGRIARATESFAAVRERLLGAAPSPTEIPMQVRQLRHARVEESQGRDDLKALSTERDETVETLVQVATYDQRLDDRSVQLQQQLHSSRAAATDEVHAEVAALDGQSAHVSALGCSNEVAAEGCPSAAPMLFSQSAPAPGAAVGGVGPVPVHTSTPTTSGAPMTRPTTVREVPLTDGVQFSSFQSSERMGASTVQFTLEGSAGRRCAVELAVGSSQQLRVLLHADSEVSRRQWWREREALKSALRARGIDVGEIRITNGIS